MVATFPGAIYMKRITSIKLVAIALACAILAGCTGRTLKPEEQSGYLKDYSDVTETRDVNGSAVYRCQSEA